MKLLLKNTIYLLLIIFFVSCATKKVIIAYKDYRKLGMVGNVEVWGGDGLSKESDIWIKNAKNSMEGVPVEYAYLKMKYGKAGEGYIMDSQSFVAKNGRYYDVLKIKTLPDSVQQNVFFDISEFYMKGF